MPTTDNYNLNFENVSTEELYELLVNQHDFSEQRVKSTLEKLKKETDGKQQKSLGDF
jgi:flap endonuclease-1